MELQGFETFVASVAVVTGEEPVALRAVQIHPLDAFGGGPFFRDVESDFAHAAAVYVACGRHGRKPSIATIWHEPVPAFRNNHGE